MTPDDPDESSFLEAMADLGVQPLDGRTPRKGGARDQAVERTRERDAPGPPGPETQPLIRDAGPTRQTAPPAGRSSSSPASPALAPGAAPDAELEARCAELEARCAELEDRCAELAQRHQNDREKFDKLAATRDRMAAELGELRRRAAELEQRAANRHTLRDALEARGCQGTAEAVAVLQALLAIRPDELIDIVDLATPEQVRSLLDNRVALVDENRSIDLGGDCAILRVPSERCEITAGSDIRAEFHGFRQACRQAGLRRVTIVGGSPAYRNELKTLAAGSRKELRIDLMSGTLQRSRRRAESNVRASDLVIIWSATELDHSVSDVYSQSDTPVLRVPHRGISRMLRHAAQFIAQSGRGKARAGKSRPPGGKRS